MENRFGRINMLSEPIEWLTDNGSCFIARDTASLLREIGVEPCTTPVRSPQSNGMAEAFVKTFKRDYVAVNPTPDAETVMAQVPYLNSQAGNCPAISLSHCKGAFHRCPRLSETAVPI